MCYKAWEDLQKLLVIAVIADSSDMEKYQGDIIKEYEIWDSKFEAGTQVFCLYFYVLFVF